MSQQDLWTITNRLWTKANIARQEAEVLKAGGKADESRQAERLADALLNEAQNFYQRARKGK